MGLAGAVVLAFGGQKDSGASLYGDALTTIALVAYIMYFVIGRRLRGWVPLMTYMMLLSGERTIEHRTHLLLSPSMHPRALTGTVWT